jgi:hypothetical protein
MKGMVNLVHHHELLVLERIKEAHRSSLEAERGAKMLLDKFDFK